MDWSLQTVVEKRCHVKAFSLNMYGGREGQKLRRFAKLHKNNLIYAKIDYKNRK